MHIVDILKYGHNTVLENVNGLPDADWLTPGVCGVWSVKEIVAHLASFEQLLVDALNSLSGIDSTPTLDRFLTNGDDFNDDEVARRQDDSVPEVWAEYQESHQQTMELLAQIPIPIHRTNGVLPWYGEAYDLEDFIVYSYYGHKQEHCAQIAVFRDRLTRTPVED